MRMSLVTPNKMATPRSKPWGLHQHVPRSPFSLHNPIAKQLTSDPKNTRELLLDISTILQSPVVTPGQGRRGLGHNDMPADLQPGHDGLTREYASPIHSPRHAKSADYMRQTSIGSPRVLQQSVMSESVSPRSPKIVRRTARSTFGESSCEFNMAQLGNQEESHHLDDSNYHLGINNLQDTCDIQGTQSVSTDDCHQKRQTLNINKGPEKLVLDAQ
eukprot:jgi/Botrbrau1/23597/Bobra.0141s0061.2